MLGGPIASSPIASGPLASGKVGALNTAGPLASSPIASNALCGASFDNVVALRPAPSQEQPKGHSAGLSAAYYNRLAELRRKRRQQLEDDKKRQLALRYAERLAEAFATADAEDAQRLAASAKRFERLLIETELTQNYLTTAASNLIKAAQAAAEMENRRRIEEQLQAAAILAARLEEELRDEEEAIFLLFA